jgi:hypothetical protein
MLTFKGEVSLTDLLTLGALLLAIVGLFLTWRQIRQGNRQKRGEFMTNLFTQYISDPGMTACFYNIEYDKFLYPEAFHGTEEEKQLDRLLSFFDNMATLCENGDLTIRDMGTFAYQYLVLYRNKQIQSYLAFLDNWCQEKHRIPVFKSFREVGKQIERAQGYE